jgi:tetratricopeptide (TPR) repeat protein
MNELLPDESRQLQEADGWLRLGNLAECEAQLARLNPKLREHPEALQILWTIASRRGDWPECLRLASLLTERAPERRFGWLHRALSLHKLGRTAEAYDESLAATERLGPNPTAPLLLARFACCLGRVNDGRKWLREAFRLAADQGTMRELKRRVLEEPELRALWPEIEPG